MFDANGTSCGVDMLTLESSKDGTWHFAVVGGAPLHGARYFAGPPDTLSFVATTISEPRVFPPLSRSDQSAWWGGALMPPLQVPVVLDAFGGSSRNLSSQAGSLVARGWKGDTVFFSPDHCPSPGPGPNYMYPRGGPGEGLGCDLFWVGELDVSAAFETVVVHYFLTAGEGRDGAESLVQWELESARR
ncbi:unnamed protein product, partial [Discosporangium mesarthrocarpum]